MEQEDIEDRLFFDVMFTHFKAVAGVLTDMQTLKTMVGRPEAVMMLLMGFFALVWYLEVTRVFYLKIPKFVFHWFQSALEGQILEHQDDQNFCYVHGIQGRRPNMEDRFLSLNIDFGMLDRSIKSVKINGVLDGHGGKFAAVFVKRYLLDSLPRKVRLLKIISHKSMSYSEKIRIYEEICGQPGIPKSVLQYINVSEEEYKQLSPQGRVIDDLNSTETRNKSHNEQNDQKNKILNSSNILKDIQDEKIIAKHLVLSERMKPLEESIQFSGIHKTHIQNELTLNSSKRISSKTSSSSKNSSKIVRRQSQSAPIEKLVDYISSSGDIMYSHLLRYSIAEADKALLERAKSSSQLGGTTLLLTILDHNILWVANVGDSRGIMTCANSEKVIPLSYDHKPCQLKEKRRIEEAGGYVAHHGVWRVQGVLATSRALGDFPLKDQGYLTSEPDVLSFNLDEAKAEVALLATDGLWDVLSNDQSAGLLRKFGEETPDWNEVAKSLTQVAHNKESMDNITVMILNLRNRDQNDSHT